MLHIMSQRKRESTERKGAGKYRKRIRQNDTLLLNIFSPYRFLLGSMHKERKRKRQVRNEGIEKTEREKEKKEKETFTSGCFPLRSSTFPLLCGLPSKRMDFNKSYEYFLRPCAQLIKHYAMKSYGRVEA
jgi:hypothetical protein